MDGATPNQTDICLAQMHKREVITQKIQTINNSITSTALVTKKLFAKTMKDLVNTVKGKLAMLANNINLNTNKKVEASTKTLTLHSTHIANCCRFVGTRI